MNITDKQTFWDDISAVISMDEIIKYPYLPWNREFLSFNKNITASIIDDINLPNAINNWNWDRLLGSMSLKEQYKCITLVQNYGYCADECSTSVFPSYYIIQRYMNRLDIYKYSILSPYEITWDNNTRVCDIFALLAKPIPIPPHLIINNSEFSDIDIMCKCLWLNPTI